MLRARANLVVPAVLWAALVPVWLSGEVEIRVPHTMAYRELEIASARGEQRELPAVVSGVNPPDVLAVPRRHFVGEPALTTTGIRGTRVEVRVGGSDSTPDLLGITTVFVTACRVIDAAERWSGRSVEWGHDGRLTLVPYWRVTDAVPAFYDQDARVVFLAVLEGRPDGPTPGRIDVARVPDAVAHEAGHAVVSTLKPGWRSGVSVVIHEGIADMTAVLVALEDPWVLERVLRETGGDLRSGNEAARLFEGIGALMGTETAGAGYGSGSLRCVLAAPCLEDCGLDPCDTNLPVALPVAVREADPHRAGQIVAAVLYDTFCHVYEDERSRGSPPARAVLEAQSRTGEVMLRALDYTGEHRVSLQDYALALLRADDAHLQGALRGALGRALVDRGLIGDERATGALIRPRPVPPLICLEPTVREHDEVLRWVEGLEERLLAAYDDSDLPAVLIRHHQRYPLAEEAKAEDMRVWSDSLGSDGFRVVRLHYQVPGSRMICPAPNGGAYTSVYADESLLPPVDVFTSLVFDPTGALVAMQTDRPWAN